MAISLLNAPERLIFSADTLKISLLADGAIEQVASKALNTLNVTTNTAAGINYIFYYGSEPVLMTSATVPDSSGNQFPAGSGTYKPASELLPYFRANTRLNNDFNISAHEDGDKVIFTAKVAAAGFDCTNTADVTNNIAGLPEIKKANYTINFALYLENSSNTGYDQIYSGNLQLLPKSENAEVYINDKLHSALSDAVREKLPERPTTEPIQCKNSCRKFYFEYAESYGEPIILRAFERSETYTVIHGGLSTVAQSRLTCLQVLAPDGPNEDKFLRQGPTEFYTRVNQPQFLYFINTRASRTAELVFDFKFFDSEEIHTITVADLNLQELRKYAFNTRYDFIYFEPVEGQLVQSYDVYLRNGEARISEVITYVMDYTLNYYIRYFLNWSSMGALDSRATTGKGETFLDYESKKAWRNPKQGENLMYGHSFTYDSRIRRLFRVATGWLTRKAMLGNADFFVSDLKYRYYSDSLLIPIHVLPSKVGETKDGDPIYAQLIEYENHFVDHAYTNGDGENEGKSIGVFGYSLGLSGIGSEEDPTVGHWIKAITQADIERWNANSRGEVVSAPAISQSGDEGFFTMVWDAAKKAKYGETGKFMVEMLNGYEPAPIRIIKDMAGKPTAYIFQLSRIDALIHIF